MVCAFIYFLLIGRVKTLFYPNIHHTIFEAAKYSLNFGQLHTFIHTQQILHSYFQYIVSLPHLQVLLHADILDVVHCLRYI